MVESHCQVNCEGLYADVDYENFTYRRYKFIKDKLVLETLTKDYEAYKEAYVKNKFLKYYSAFDVYRSGRLVYHPLQVVQIYFSTATFDHIVNDVSVTFGDQISAIDACLHSSLLHSELKIVFLLLYLIIQFIVT